MLALVDATAAAVTGVTLGMVSADDMAFFYLYHLPLNTTTTGLSTVPIRGLTPVTPASNGSTILFLNNNADEGLMFSPPQGSNTEWLIPLDVEAGGTVVHYDVATKLLQIDQVHGELKAGSYHFADIQQILWLEAQHSFYGFSVDADYVHGYLNMDLYADMVNELQQRDPEPVHNLTLTLGTAYDQFILEKQTMAVSQKQQLMFLMPGVWNQKTNLYYAVLWTYDVVANTVSKPVAYRNDSTIVPFISTLVYSEKRTALYAIVAVFSESSDRIVQLLVDRINWTTGAVTNITSAVPLPDAGLAELSATLDDDSGDIYITFMSIDPKVAGYVIFINTVNVDTSEVNTVAELPTNDIPLSVSLIHSSSGGSSTNKSNINKLEKRHRQGRAATSARRPLFDALRRLKRRSKMASQMKRK